MGIKLFVLAGCGCNTPLLSVIFQSLVQSMSVPCSILPHESCSGIGTTFTIVIDRLLNGFSVETIAPHHYAAIPRAIRNKHTVKRLSKIITSSLTTKGRLLLLYSFYFLMSGRKLRAETYNLVPLTSVVVLGFLRFLLHLIFLSRMHRSLSGLETFQVDPAKGPFMLQIFRLTCDLQTCLDG